MPGSAFDYETGELRGGAKRARHTADTAEQVGTRLASLAVNTSAFGDVDGAAAFATGVGTVRDGFGRTAHDVAARHVDLDAGGDQVAGLGDSLVGETTRLARQPGPISQAMQG